MLILNHIVLGKGKDVIFLHGWGGSIESFRGAAEYFCGAYRCTLVDFYGFGKSKAEKPLTLYDYADAVEEIIEAYNMREVVLVGHSFGGRVAILLASRLGCVKGAVLVDSAGMKPRFSFKRARRVLVYKFKKALRMDVSGCGSEDYRALDGVMKTTFKNVVNFYLEDFLADIACPVLLIWGRYDKDTPLYMAKRMKKKIKDSGLIILKGGHYSYLDEYGTFLAVLDSFFKDICN